jgi:hypothetical protein
MQRICKGYAKRNLIMITCGFDFAKSNPYIKWMPSEARLPSAMDYQSILWGDSPVF